MDSLTSAHIEGFRTYSINKDKSISFLRRGENDFIQATMDPETKDYVFRAVPAWVAHASIATFGFQEAQ
jgi:hypothetical protein